METSKPSAENTPVINSKTGADLLLSSADEAQGESEEVYNEAHDEDEPAAARRKRQNETGEVGGPKGLEPTRYGDWEVNGRCSDF